MINSVYAWRRLAVSVTLSTLGGIGMWALAVAMPAVQGDLGVSRADISFAYSMNMIGFFLGGVIVGRLVDRHGIVVASVRERARPRRRASASPRPPPRC